MSAESLPSKNFRSKDFSRPRVAVIGGGFAGLTAALRLAQRGYDVTIYEAKDTLGGNVRFPYGLKGFPIGTAIPDVYPHLFCDWYVNFWTICEELGLCRTRDFEPRASVKFLRHGSQHHQELKSAAGWHSLWDNLVSGVLPLPEMFIFGFSGLDLAAQPPDPLEHSVHGFLHSRSYMTDRVAKLHDLLLMEVWSIHSNQTSATSYKLLAKHVLSPILSDRPIAWLLKGSVKDKLIDPFVEKLQTELGCKIRKGPGQGNGKVTWVRLEQEKIKISTTILSNGPPSPQDETAWYEAWSSGQDLLPNLKPPDYEDPPFDYLVLAVPPPELAALVRNGPKGYRIVDRLPKLAELQRLRGAQIAVLHLSFNRKLDNVPKEHVGLIGSEYYLTFVDVSQIGNSHSTPQAPTKLVVAASDFYALPSNRWEQNAFLMITKLHDNLPFRPGDFWGDTKSDIDWNGSKFFANDDHKLFIDEVGIWDWRPETTYDALPNVFFAGDFCGTDIGMATVEAAVESGAQAAQALQKRSPRGDSIVVEQHKLNSDARFLAAKLALLPLAYGAKCASLVADAVAPAQDGNRAGRILSAAAGIPELPLTYTTDWLATAYALARSLVCDPAPLDIRAGLPHAPDATRKRKLSGVYELASELWQAVRATYNGAEVYDSDERVEDRGHWRYARVKR